MKKRATVITAAILVLAGVATAIHTAGASRHRNREAASHGAPASPMYAEACGGCHFAYQPWLLPAASWTRILDGLQDHFGNAVDLDAAQKASLRAYLAQNAADTSSDRRARNMLRGLDGQAPLRITETPCFLRKHRRLDQSVFQRPAVGGAGNCPACHTTAAAGDYDDGNVRVPR